MAGCVWEGLLLHNFHLLTLFVLCDRPRTASQTVGVSVVRRVVCGIPK